MANCPWNKNGCCKRNGMTMTVATLGKMNGICYGRQVNGMRYTQCSYYVNPKEGASGKTTPCKFCQRKENATRYLSYCCSNKYPGADGVHPQYVDDDNLTGICIGRRIGGKKYTQCKYYKGAKRIEGQKSGTAYLNSINTSEDLSLLDLVIILFKHIFIHIIILTCAFSALSARSLPGKAIGVLILAAWVYKITRKFIKKDSKK